MSGYRAGAALERETRHILDENGYYTVRSAGSKGVADVVAWKGAETLFVQCKKARPPGPDERRALTGMAEEYGGVPLLAYWHKDGRKARQVRFVRLVNGGPVRLQPLWAPDHGMERTS